MARLEILKAASEDFASKLRENTIDPIEQIGSDLPLLEPFERCQVMLALCAFKYPKLKPIEQKKLENPYGGMTKLELLQQMKAGVLMLEDEIQADAREMRKPLPIGRPEAPGENE